MKILVTGGAGFIASHFVRYLVRKYPEHIIINYDSLTYAGSLARLKDIEQEPNYQFVKGDICDFNFLVHLMKGISYVFHFAAESHVGKSIGDSLRFTQTNALGTHVLLEAARINNVKKFFHMSTDEVYGDIVEGFFKSDSALNPTNPYSGSKAAGDMIVFGYKKTYNFPAVIIRCNNVYGPYQHTEKVIPKFTSNLIEGKKITVHGNGSNIRTYLHIDDFCRAMNLIFQKGEIGEIYNLGTVDEISNLELAKKILRYFGKGEDFLEFVMDRPFNDRRYGVEIDKIKNLGWTQKISLEEGLHSTIEWYEQNKNWWKNLKPIPAEDFDISKPEKKFLE